MSEENTTNIKQSLSNVSGGLNTNVDGNLEITGDLVAGDYNIQAEGVQGDLFQNSQITYNYYNNIPESKVADKEPEAGEPCYKGVLPYYEMDARYFFGRNKLTAALVGHLRTQPFLILTGASGCGKSSLIRAGLIPALQSTILLADGTAPPDGSLRWPVHFITPSASPLESLAASLTRDNESVTAAFTLAQDMRQDERSLNLMARRLNNAAGSERLLLVVDQAEELFTRCKDEEERLAFIANLVSAVDQRAGSVVIIFCYRISFRELFINLPVVGPVFAQYEKIVPPLTLLQMQDCIEAPADVGDKNGPWEFETGLVDLIVREIQNEPYVIPWLSLVLLETWKRRRGRIMTFSSYAESLGVRGAILQKCTAIYQQFTEDQKLVAQTIFLRLTELGEGTQDGSRIVPLLEILPNGVKNPNADLLYVLQELADARLIVVAADGIRVIHETMIRDWPPVREWIAVNRPGLRLQRQLAHDTNRWLWLNRDLGALYRGAKLEQTLEWANTNPAEVTPIEWEFLNLSQEIIAQEIKAKEEAQQRELEIAQRLAESAQKLAENERERASEQQKRAEKEREVAKHLEQGAKRLKMMLAVACVLGIFALSAMYLAVISALENATSQRIARARELAIASLSEIHFPQRSLLLAVEAYNVLEPNDGNVPQLEEALRQALRNAGGRSLQSRVSLQTTSHHTTPEAVTNLIFSANGRWLAFGTMQGTVELWERTADSTTLITLEHQLSGLRVLDVVISPDSEYLYASFEGGILLMWDLIELNTPPVPVFEDSGIYFLSLAVNEHFIAAGGETGQVYVWDRQNFLGDPLAVLTDHQGPVYEMALTADKLVTGGGDTNVFVYDLADLEEEPDLISWHDEIISGLAVSQDGQKVVTAGGTPPWVAANSHDAVAYLWSFDNLDEPEAIFELPESYITSIALNPTADLLLLGGWDNLGYLFNTHQPQNDPYILRGHEQSIFAVDFAADGLWMATGGGDGAVRLWNLADRSQGLTASPFVLRGHNQALKAVEISPDNVWVGTGDGNGEVRLWQLQSADPVVNSFVLEAHNAPITTLKFSPDSRWLATADTAGQLYLWSLSSSRPNLVPIPLPKHTQAIRQLQFLPDEQTLISGGADGLVLVWSLSDPAAPPRQLKTPAGEVHSLTIPPGANPNGWLVVGMSRPTPGRDVRDYPLALYPLSDLEAAPHLLNGHTAEIRTLAITPDENRLISGGADGRVLVWDLRHLEAEPYALHYPDGVLELLVTPNNQWLFVAGYSIDIFVWHLNNLEAEPLRLSNHQAWINDMVLSSTGRWLVSTSYYDETTLWDLTQDPPFSGVVLDRYTFNTTHLAISTDEQWVVAGNNDHTARLLSLDVDSLLELACHTAGRNLYNSRDEWFTFFQGEEYRTTCP